MNEKETLGAFFNESGHLAVEWLEDRIRLYKLKAMRTFSRTAAFLMRILFTVITVFFFLLFLGITAGFWLSELTGSYVRGFGLVTVAILILAILLFLFRKTLFIDPIIRNMIRKYAAEDREIKK